MKKWIARAAVAVAAFAGVVAISPASPAEASVCTTKGCGGEVANNSSRLVYVTNCWLSSNPATWRGTKPSCATQYTTAAYNAYFAMGHPDVTNHYYHFYDTDAFRVDAGCVLNMNDGFANRTFNNRETQATCG